MSSNILLKKSQFSILDSHTEKSIPFLYSGDKSPSYLRISDQEIPQNFANKSLSGSDIDLIPGHNRSVSSGGQDDWSHDLSRSDFTGNHLQVSGVSVSERLSQRSEDYPSSVDWSNLVVTKSGDNMVVSGYDDAQVVTSMDRKILYPWRESWEQIGVEQIEGTKNAQVSIQNSILRILEGIVLIEPTERSWTWPSSNEEYVDPGSQIAQEGRMFPSYNYPYSTEEYDIEISGCPQHNGLYKILNESSFGLNRIWVLNSITVKKAICWDSVNYRWQLVQYSSYDAENNAVVVDGDPLMTQYISPFDESTSWLYGECDSANKRLTFQNAGVNVLSRKGTSPFGKWLSVLSNDTVTGFAVDSSSGSDESEITVVGTKYRELSRNNTAIVGNWSNGVTVSQSGTSLIVVGFDEEDANGTYEKFEFEGVSDPSIPQDIWIKYGKKTKYSISYDSSLNCWRLCTTVDGVYEIVDGTKSSVFRTWKDASSDEEESNSGSSSNESDEYFSNIICFNRYDNSFYIRNCKSLTLDFLHSDSESSSTVWTSGNYQLRYSPSDYCWKLYDVANNVVSCQVINQTSWDDFDDSTDYENTIIDIPENNVDPGSVVMSGAPFGGEYIVEDFDRSLHPFSMCKNAGIKSYYVLYDSQSSKWKLAVKLNADGIYKLDNDVIQMKDRSWEKVDSGNLVEESYKIVYNLELSRWELRDYWSSDSESISGSENENIYDHTLENELLPEPFEASYGLNGHIIEGSGSSIKVSGFTGWSDAGDSSNNTDVYSLISGEGSSRVWQREGINGIYQIDWDTNEREWRLKFINIKVNGIYSYVSNSGSTSRANSIWSLTVGALEYQIRWSGLCWKLFKVNSPAEDDVISESVTTTFDSISSGWSNQISVSLSGDNLIISGESESDAYGEYALSERQITSPFEKEWTRIVNGVSLFTVSYDFSELRWKLVFDDLDSNGSYYPYGQNDSGTSRRWSHEGTNGKVYVIDWDPANLRWEIRNIEKYVPTNDAAAVHGKTYFVRVSQIDGYAQLVEGTNWITGDTDTVGSVTVNGDTYSVAGVPISEWCEFIEPLDWQTTQNESDPTDGHWQNNASVLDPFISSSVWSVGVRYTPIEKQQYNYVMSGNNYTDESKARYNSTYTIQDRTATGKNRVWKSSNDTYILWVEESNAWVITSNRSLQSIGYEYRTDDVVCAWTNSNSSYADYQDLSTLSWNTNYYTFNGTFSIKKSYVEEYGKNKQFWALAIYSETIGSEIKYVTSNIVRFQLSVVQDDISNVSLNLIGSSGNSEYTGFFKTDDNDFALSGSYIPTDFITVNYSAYSLNPLRISFTGVTVPGVNFETEHTSSSVLTKVGILDETTLGDQDTTFEIKMTVRDEAGNSRELARKITYIARLWRMQGTHIKEDSTSYSTKVYSVSPTGGLSIIPRTQINENEYVRAWDDIFYPATHGYPTLDDGSIDKENAIRISQATVDESGISGPTSDELKMYDKLTLTTDGTDLSTDADGRYMTSGWNRTKTYSRMESSSYGASGENLKYWIIDNSGYSDLQLEFEYFDLSSQISNIPRNNLSPYEGDVLVIYDASAEGCLGAETDQFGKTHPVLADSSKLVELYAFTGSHYNDDISMKSDSNSVFDLQDFGFITPKITSTSKICMILYTDNDYQLSGFKVKAGPRHTSTIYNYEMLNSTGEIWVHRAPGVESDVWSSPSRLSTTHQYTTSNSIIDYERGTVTFDTDAGPTITGDFTVYNYMTNTLSLIPDASNPSGKWVMENFAPKSNFSYLLLTGDYAYSDIKSFLLYNDDCVDYYDIAVCVTPSGVSTDYSSIYDYMNPSKNFGKITSGFISNKDKGMIVFSSEVPLGRMFANYNYHTYYRLTNDGYGDLYFYDNALIPSADYSLTGLKDWTYVDLMIYNEGSNALSEGLMKFMSRGYISGSGSSQTITQVVDENRPWDVQSGTIAETVNRTGASFNVSYTGLPEKTRAAAITAISNSSGGVSLGSILSARSKAYMRIYWCLAQSAGNGSVTYVTTTRGKKLWSSEISGKYYVVTM